jgi:hypothetical protein
MLKNKNIKFINISNNEDCQNSESDNDSDSKSDYIPKLNGGSKVKEKIVIKNISKDNYKKPPQTYTDLLTKKDIQNKLLDYEKVDKLDDNIIGFHCRYFELKDNEYKFRMGGLIKNVGLPEYVVMTNGKVSWSVQVKNCIFFKRITIKSIKDEYEKVIIDKDNQINELTLFIKRLQKQISEFKNKK